MKKEIKVLKEISPVIDIKRIQSKVFRSYKAIAEMLEPGEKVLVAVHEHTTIKIFAGYGEVERTEDGWIEPKRLLLDY